MRVQEIKDKLKGKYYDIIHFVKGTFRLIDIPL